MGRLFRCAKLAACATTPHSCAAAFLANPWTMGDPMTEADYTELLNELGLCQCDPDDETVDMVRDILEIGELACEGHEAAEEGDEVEAAECNREAWLRLNAVLLPRHPSRLFVLASLSARGLIEHTQGDPETFWLTERGADCLEHMRQVELQVLTDGPVVGGVAGSGIEGDGSKLN